MMHPASVSFFLPQVVDLPYATPSRRHSIRYARIPQGSAGFFSSNTLGLLAPAGHLERRGETGSGTLDWPILSRRGCLTEPAVTIHRLGRDPPAFGRYLSRWRGRGPLCYRIRCRCQSSRTVQRPNAASLGRDERPSRDGADFTRSRRRSDDDRRPWANPARFSPDRKSVPVPPRSEGPRRRSALEASAWRANRRITTGP